MTLGPSTFLSLAKDRAIRLLQYLSELHALIHPSRTHPRDLWDYGKDALFFLEDLKGYKEFSGLLLDPDPGKQEEQEAEWVEEAWLVVLRPKKPSDPEPPEEIQHWLDWEGKSPTSPPRLKEKRQCGDRTVELSRYPSIRQAYERFLREDWEPWCVQYRRFQKLALEYRKLFKIHQRIQQEEEKYELLYCPGLLVWTPKDGEKIRHPILAFPLTIEHEEASGKILVFPDPNRKGGAIPDGFS